MTNTRWNRILPAVAVAVLVIVGVGYTDAAPGGGSATSSRLITLHATRMPVIDAIDKLFGQAGYTYTIQPGVGGEITLGLKDVTFADALKSLAAGADLDYKVTGGRYIISPKPKPKVVLTVTPPAPATTTDQPDVQAPDAAPVFYGNLPLAYQPQPQPQVIPVGSGALVALPNGDALYVTGQSNVDTGRSVIEQYPGTFNDAGWRRLRDFGEQYRTLFPRSY
jgi:hypothetical protein